MPRSQLLPINVSAVQQPCSQFGIHHNLPVLQQLYDEGDAAILANIGPLVEPIDDKADYLSGAKQTPVSLFSHSAQQRATQSVHAQERDPAGVLGRMFAALSDQSIEAQQRPKTEAYSISGNALMLESPHVGYTTILGSNGERLDAALPYASDLGLG